MNSRSELVKGSHNTKYVTCMRPTLSRIIHRAKFKATDILQGQSVNGALAGEKGSKLPLQPDSH